MVSFDPGTHTYKDGDQEIPSVTQLLKAAGQIDDTWYQPAGTERGSAVHDATAAIDNGDLDLSAFIDADYYPYVAAYMKFKEDTGVEILDVEKRVHHPAMGYAGTLDRIGIINGQKMLFDLKTGKAKSFWHGLQLTAYEACLEPMEKRILFLGDNGKYSFVSSWKTIPFSHGMWRSYWGSIATKAKYDRIYL